MAGKSAKVIVLLSLFAVTDVVLPGREAIAQRNTVQQTDAIRYIANLISEYPIVCLGEGGHQARKPHEFLRALLSDPDVLRELDVVIVEFATSRYQRVLDDFIMGRDVPYDELCRVWRDTSTSPIAPWNSPLYFELLKLIRDNNRSLAANKRIRVLAGDPPIEWEKIRNRRDFEDASTSRNDYASELAMEQAFTLNKKVLIIYGGAHLPKASVGAKDDPRNSISYRIQLEHRGLLQVIEFLQPEDLGVEDRMNELEEGMIYVTKDHWIGEIDARRFFPETYTIVTDSETGEKRWEKGVLYRGLPVKELFDALIYIGPSSEWGIVGDSPEIYQDEEYWTELNRRSMIRFGRSMDSRLRKNPPGDG